MLKRDTCLGVPVHGAGRGRDVHRLLDRLDPRPPARADAGGYFRNWAAHRHGKRRQLDLAVPDWLRSLWHYEHEVYSFHVGLTAGHTYQSNPWSWIVLGRPVSYFYESRAAGQDGCPVRRGREVRPRGPGARHPAAVVGGVLRAPATSCGAGCFRRDWRAGAIACGIAAGYLPWFLYQERTIFFFYAVVFVPFLCLAVAMMIGAIIGPPRLRRDPPGGRGDRARACWSC